MISRLCFSFVFIVSFFDAQSVFAMQEQDNLGIAYAKLADAGYVPSMARIPKSDSVQNVSAQIHDCIPSGRCDGSCYTVARKDAIKQKIVELERQSSQSEQEADLLQLAGLLRKVAKRVGKSAAIAIAQGAIDESSDSDDTQSTDSLNSPTGTEGDDLLAEFLDPK